MNFNEKRASTDDLLVLILSVPGHCLYFYRFLFVCARSISKVGILLIANRCFGIFLHTKHKLWVLIKSVLVRYF